MIRSSISIQLYTNCSYFLLFKLSVIFYISYLMVFLSNAILIPFTSFNLIKVSYHLFLQLTSSPFVFVQATFIYTQKSYLSICPSPSQHWYTVYCIFPRPWEAGGFSILAVPFNQAQPERNSPIENPATLLGALVSLMPGGKMRTVEEDGSHMGL